MGPLAWWMHRKLASRTVSDFSYVCLRSGICGDLLLIGASSRSKCRTFCGSSWTSSDPDGEKAAGVGAAVVGPFAEPVPLGQVNSDPIVAVRLAAVELWIPHASNEPHGAGY